MVLELRWKLLQLQKCCRVAAELLPVCLLQSLQLAACLTRPQVDTSSQRRPRSPTPAGLPLLNRRVYATEQKMAELRDGQYDPMEAKNDARNARLKRHTS